MEQLKISSRPSEVVRQVEKFIDFNGPLEKVIIKLTLVTMRRSFLLAINRVNSVKESGDTMSNEDMINCFRDSNTSLNGLSLAIGDQSTCLVPSDNSVASATLATRLSKKLNSNRPVYVASSINLADEMSESNLMPKLYLKIFQFLQANYDCDCA